MTDTPNLQPEVVVNLTFPIKVKGQEVHQLTLRRPNLGMLMQLNDLGLRIKDGTEVTGLGLVAIKAVAHMAGLSVIEAQAIDLVDLAEIVKAVAGFFGNSEAIGKIVSRQFAPPSL